MTTPRTMPTLALEVLQEHKLADLTPADVIRGFKANDIPISDIIDGFLKCDPIKTELFHFRARCLTQNIHKSDRDKVEAVYYDSFKDILSLEPSKILETPDFASKTTRELILFGTFYALGIMVDKNRDIASHLYQQAANRGDEIGLTYFAYEKLHRGNRAEAKSLFLKASTRGCAYATTCLAIYIEEKSLSNYISAIRAKQSVAMLMLATDFDHGIRGLEKNKTIALQLYAASIFLGCNSGLEGYARLLPYEEQWQFIRLTKQTNSMTSELEEHTLDPAPALIYHSALVLGKTSQHAGLKKNLNKLCAEQPDTVMRLSRQLDDSEEDILSLIYDDNQRDVLTVLCFHHQETNFISPPLFNIMLQYLELSTFACSYVMEKENFEKDVMKFKVSHVSMFSKSIQKIILENAARAEKGEITYRTATRS